MAFEYTDGKAASNVNFSIPSSIAPATNYEFRLFANDGFTRLGTSGTIAVT